MLVITIRNTQDILTKNVSDYNKEYSRYFNEKMLVNTIRSTQYISTKNVSEYNKE